MNYIEINWEAVIVLILFLSMNFLPGGLCLTILLVNFLSFILLSLIIYKRANLTHYNEQPNKVKEFFVRNGDTISLISISIFGLFFAIYDICIFWKSPLKKDFENMQQQERDKKLKKLGI